MGTSAVPDMSSPLAGSSANLSLNQKQKMLADSENLKRMANQPQLTPIAGPRTSMSPLTSSQKGSTDIKDLTSSLMSANLNQMKHSQSFSGKTFNSATSSSQGTTFLSNTIRHLTKIIYLSNYCLYNIITVFVAPRMEYNGK